MKNKLRNLISIFPVVLVILMISVLLPLGRTFAQHNAMDQYVFLPVMAGDSYVSTSLRGLVTKDGSPVEGEPVYIYRNDVSKIATTYTDANGVYNFHNVQTVTGDDYLEVTWHRGSMPDPSELGYFNCNPIDANTVLPYQQVCNIDIAGVDLQDPNGTTVSMPVTFSWSDRGLGDTYQVYLTTAYHSDVSYTMDAGTSTSYQLTAIPQGFVTGENYTWWVLVNNQYGTGATSFFNYVAFSE